LLFETASGYSLFIRTESEEIGQLEQDVQAHLLDFGLFSKQVKLKSFVAFESAAEALENINNISEGVLSPKLKHFLELNLNSEKDVILGVADDKIKVAIHEALGIACVKNLSVEELMRGIRLHFAKYIKGLQEDAVKRGDIIKTQLGLGHAYSRAKVKFNIHKADNMIIQAISLLDQLDKDLNLFTMRVREWYSWHFPELIKIVTDNIMYARVVKQIRDKETITSRLKELEAVVGDAELTQQIANAAKSSMGTEINEIDMLNITRFANKVVQLAEFRESLHKYLLEKMGSVAPNLSALIGEMVGARLISKAGSLTSLAKAPASTVQILGAEKALFRALKTRGNTPKYGILFNSSFIGKAKSKDKGRMARFLANKCSIASRIDSFREFPTQVFGLKLREQVEDRLKFFESGTLPPKNVDVMRSAVQEAGAQDKIDQSSSTHLVTDNMEVEPTETKPKKRKRERKTSSEGASQRSSQEAHTISSENTPTIPTPETTTPESAPGSSKRKKKKRRKSQEALVHTSDVATTQEVQTEHSEITSTPAPTTPESTPSSSKKKE